MPSLINSLLYSFNAIICLLCNSNIYLLDTFTVASSWLYSYEFQKNIWILYFSKSAIIYNQVVCSDIMVFSTKAKKNACLIVVNLYLVQSYGYLVDIYQKLSYFLYLSNYSIPFSYDFANVEHLNYKPP